MARVHLGGIHEAHLLDGARDGRGQLDLTEAIRLLGGEHGGQEG
jgi:hypothetical protein